MPPDDLPGWLPDWCVDQLGSGPVGVLFTRRSISAVFGLRLAIGFLDERDQSAVPAYVADTAARARKRLLAANLPCVLGHGDFEAQNLRWHNEDVWVVHDWDSLTWRPTRISGGAGSPRRSKRSHGRPACGCRLTTPARKPSTAIPRCPLMPSARRRPNA